MSFVAPAWLIRPRFVLLRWRLRRALAAAPARALILLRCFLAGFVGAAAVAVALAVGVLVVPLVLLGVLAWALWPSTPASK